MADMMAQYDALLVQKQVAPKYHSYLRMWVWAYRNFCREQGVPEHHVESLDRYMLALAEQGKASFQQKQAAQAVTVYKELLGENGGQGQPFSETISCASQRIRDGGGSSVGKHEYDVPEVWKRVYDELFTVIRMRHYSQKTIRTYTTWLRLFQGFSRDKDPAALMPEDVKAFLNHLAVERRVAASTQNQAFNALLFLFRHILHKDFGDHRDTIRAKSRPYIPVVLSRQEVDAVLAGLRPPHDLVVKLLYGCGLRLFECVKLRLHNFNFDAGILTVHDGKGKKDRTVPLPWVLLPELQAQIDRVKALHDKDIEAGYAGVFLDS